VIVLRENKRIPIEVKIAELKEEEKVAGAPNTNKLGLSVQTVTPDIARSLGLDRARGVIVSAVEPGSPAAEAGLRRGDILLEMNRRPIASAGELQKILDKAKPGENLLFLVRRNGNNIFLALQSPGAQG